MTQLSQHETHVTFHVPLGGFFDLWVCLGNLLMYLLNNFYDKRVHRTIIFHLKFVEKKYQWSMAIKLKIQCTYNELDNRASWKFFTYNLHPKLQPYCLVALNLCCSLRRLVLRLSVVVQYLDTINDSQSYHPFVFQMTHQSLYFLNTMLYLVEVVL